jgi:hypothetical protein
MGYYKLTRGASGEIGVDRAAKNLDGKILQPIITDNGGTAIFNSWFANLYASIIGSKEGDINVVRDLHVNDNKINGILIPTDKAGKTLATTDQISGGGGGQILTGTFTTDETGTPTFSPDNIDGSKIIAANDDIACTCIYDMQDGVILKLTSEDGKFELAKNIAHGVCYYIG